MPAIEKEIFKRTELLLGSDVLARLSETKVILLGIGGVGSWCAEGLVRSGLRKLCIVDSDCVSPSNINRQLMATINSVGVPKVDALKSKLLEINPRAEIEALQLQYSEETAGQFRLSDYDYVIDAIDTLKNKVQLITDACSCGAVFFSSLGAALKMDPTRIRTGNFWKVRDCPLGAALRKKLRRTKAIPEVPFTCVYSGELLENRGYKDMDAEELLNEASAGGKAIINGSIAPVTAVFGMTLASLVIQDVYNRSSGPKSNF